MKYRPEIDGLRAVAVVPVIFFHAGVGFVSGGYVGVDIFFVISGYLITQIIIDDLNRGQFSILGFYERRVRRILPALCFVLLLCVGPAWFLMSKNEFQDFSESLLAAAFFSSNFIFWLQSGYFDSVAELKPLLHTWSLAVEEQFYIFFPVFLALFWKYCPKVIMISVVLMAALSLGAAEIGLRYFPTANYYLAPTRIWEFFFGAIAAFFVQRHGIRANQGMSMLGIFLIFLAIFTYDRNTPFPGIYTTIPCFGTLFIILFANENTFIGRLLSRKFFVFIGLISYSAYLLHQPIFSFVRIMMPRPELGLMVSVVIVFPLACLSWMFIEKPFRYTQKLSQNSVLILAALSIIFVGLLSQGLAYANKKRSDSISMPEDYIQAKKDERFKYIGLVCTRKGWDTCNAPEKGRINILSIGDSHEVDGYNSLYLALENSLDKISLSSSSLGACPPVQNIRKIVPPTHPDLVKCELLNAKRFDTTYLNSYDVIAVSVMFGWYQEKNLLEYLDFLKRNFRGKVIVFGGTFGFRKPLPDVFVESYSNELVDMEDFIVFDPRIGEELLRNYSTQNGFLFISKIDAFCHRSRCNFKFDDNLLSYDQHHLSLDAVHQFTDQNKKEIQSFVLDTILSSR